jgi:hypothetical protein
MRRGSVNIGRPWAQEFREAKPRIAVLRDGDGGEPNKAYAARARVTAPIESFPASLIRFSAIAAQKNTKLMMKVPVGRLCYRRRGLIRV